MTARLPGLVVLPGFACNFFCAHCISGARKKGKLTEAEIEAIGRAISKYKIGKLHFVGGEPTLHKQVINRLLARTRFTGAVSLTTNGHFAKTVAAAKHELEGYSGLKAVQLSYDKFHAKFLPFQNIQNLYSACKELGIKFSVILTVQSPLDIGLAGELKKVGPFRIGVQKVIPAGSAKINDVGYKFPVFDAAVLSKKCPNKGKIAFLHGYGFSVCCGAPDFDPGPIRFSHPELEEHLQSRFFRLIRNKTFGGIMSALKVSLKYFSPEHSDPCVICGTIFSLYAKQQAAAL